MGRIGIVPDSENKTTMMSSWDNHKGFRTDPTLLRCGTELHQPNRWAKHEWSVQLKESSVVSGTDGSGQYRNAVASGPCGISKLGAARLLRSHESPVELR